MIFAKSEIQKSVVRVATTCTAAAKESKSGRAGQVQ